VKGCCMIVVHLVYNNHSPSFFSNKLPKRNIINREEIVTLRKREGTSQFLTQTKWRREEVSKIFLLSFHSFRCRFYRLFGLFFVDLLLLYFFFLANKVLLWKQNRREEGRETCSLFPFFCRLIQRQRERTPLFLLMAESFREFETAVK
jgi:hypothetical protein